MEEQNIILIQQFEHFQIEIHGDYLQPLFKASDIGNLLEIKDINSTIKKFDEDEKIITNTLGGHEINMLTENGLYKLLMISRKPVAKTFQKWVFNTIRDIRLNSNKELQLKLETQQQQIAYYKEENYTPTQFQEVVYIHTTDVHDVYKVGMTAKNNANNRKAGSQTNCVDNIKILYEFKTCNSAILEKMVHCILERYRNSAREHFRCNLEYIKLIIDTVGTVFNRSKCTSQMISKEQYKEVLELDIPQPIYLEIKSETKKVKSYTREPKVYSPKRISVGIDECDSLLYEKRVDEFLAELFPEEYEQKKILIEVLN